MPRYEIYIAQSKHIALAIIDTFVRVLDIDPNIFSVLDCMDGKYGIFSTNMHSPIRLKAMKYIADGFESGYDFATKE